MGQIQCNGKFWPSSEREMETGFRGCKMNTTWAGKVNIMQIRGGGGGGGGVGGGGGGGGNVEGMCYKITTSLRMGST